MDLLYASTALMSIHGLHSLVQTPGGTPVNVLRAPAMAVLYSRPTLRAPPLGRHAILVRRERYPAGGTNMTSEPQRQRVWSRRRFLQQTLAGMAGGATWHGWPSRHRAIAQKGAPTGQMTWAMHFALTPKWFDPGETGG